MATSYNGWPASPYPSAIGINQGWEPIRGHKFPGGIKSGDVETVMTYFVRQLDARAEPIEEYAPGDEWGWNYKYSANSPALLSCHASGTAFDYNAVQHPNGVRGTWSNSQVAVIRAIQREVNYVVFWRGDSTHTADEMHFEIKGTSLDVAAAARKIKAGGTTPAPAPGPVPVPVPEPKKKPPKENPMLIVRKAKKIHRLLLINGVTIVAHDPLSTNTPTTPTLEVDENLWNFLVDVAKFTNTLLDPRA